MLAFYLHCSRSAALMLLLRSLPINSGPALSFGMATSEQERNGSLWMAPESHFLTLHTTSRLLEMQPPSLKLSGSWLHRERERDTLRGLLVLRATNRVSDFSLCNKRARERLPCKGGKKTHNQKQLPLIINSRVVRPHLSGRLSRAADAAHPPTTVCRIANCTSGSAALISFRHIFCISRAADLALLWPEFIAPRRPFAKLKPVATTSCSLSAKPRERSLSLSVSCVCQARQKLPVTLRKMATFCSIRLGGKLNK